MAKFLRIDPGFNSETKQLTGIIYRLPAETEIRGLLEDLVETLRGGDSLTVTVEMSGDPGTQAFIVINGSTVGHVLVSEINEPSA